MSCLSDDENNEKISQGSGPERPPPIPRRPARGFRGQMPAENLNTADPRKLNNLIRGKCGCTCRCFLPFQQDPLLRRWVALRKTMSQMTKLEKDNHVLNSVISYIYSIAKITNFIVPSYPPSGLVSEGVWDAERPERGSLQGFKAPPHLGAAPVQQRVPKDDGHWKETVLHTKHCCPKW